LGFAFLASWIVQIPLLWPLPPQLAREAAASVRETLEATKDASPNDPEWQANREAVQRLADDPSILGRGFWQKWVGNVVLLVCGVTASVMAIRGSRFAIPAIVLTAVGYIWHADFLSFLQLYLRHAPSLEGLPYLLGVITRQWRFFVSVLLLPTFYLLTLLTVAAVSLVSWRQARRAADAGL
jgi:hypothetical protein